MKSLINKPGFPCSWVRIGTYQIQYCSGEVALKLTRSQSLQTRPRLPVIFEWDRFKVWYYNYTFPESFNIKQGSTFWGPLAMLEFKDELWNARTIA